ncbi:MAG TPA: pectate lyase [Isosphaeraceae bacterium]|jgi:pectate lyase
MTRPFRPTLAALLLLAASSAALAKSFPWRALADKPDAWYRSDEAARLLENVLSNQADLGDWPKNIDTSEAPYEGDRAKLRGTFDNGATVGELRLLARAFVAVGKARYRDAFLKGLDHVLAAQYSSGGWPQTSPPGTGYPRYITFNDNTTVNLLELVRDVSRSNGFRFVDSGRREAAGRAFASGIACVLKCQIKVDGRPTVWCAQHDEVTLEPRPARTFELVSLSGSESAGILLLLMSLDEPSPEVVRAVEAGARWFDSAKLTGIRQVGGGGDKKVVADPKAPPLWARFYEIDTGRPFFCGRDGVKKYSLAEIEAERRNGYAWYGEWGSKVAARYAGWKAEHGETPSR